MVDDPWLALYIQRQIDPMGTTGCQAQCVGVLRLLAGARLVDGPSQERGLAKALRVGRKSSADRGMARIALL